MQTAAVKKMELINKIAKLPEQKISEVDSFIQKLLAQLDLTKTEPISLKGIWKNTGLFNSKIPQKIRDLIIL